MPRRLIDEIASLDEEEELEHEEKREEKKQETRIDSLHLEPDLGMLIEQLEKRRLEILRQVRQLLNELKEINTKLRKARQLQQLNKIKINSSYRL